MDRVLRLVKENSKALAALRAARRARKEKARPGTHSDGGSCLGRVGMGNRGTAIRPLVHSLVLGVKASLAAHHPLLQHLHPPHPGSGLQAESPSLPGASHAERRRRGRRRKDRRGGRSRGGLF